MAKYVSKTVSWIGGDVFDLINTPVQNCAPHREVQPHRPGELGLVGVGLFLLVFAYYVKGALQYLRHNSEPAAAWPVTFLAFVFFTNLTTAFFLVSNSIYFILYAAIATTLYTTRSRTRAAIKLAEAGPSYA